jgi:hypothetical protein
MSRTWNINSQGAPTATRVYNLCLYRSYTNRNTTQGTMVCPATVSSLSLLAHDFMLEANIPCTICTITYTAMALWTIDSVLCTHSMIPHELPPHYAFQYSVPWLLLQNHALYGQMLSISLALFLYKYCLPKPWLLFMLLNISQDWSTICVSK